MRRVLALLSLIIASLFLASCNKETGPVSLVGQWEAYQVVETLYVNGVYKGSETSVVTGDNVYLFEFRNDGNFTLVIDYDGDVESGRGTYTKSENKLFLTIGNTTFSYKIDSLNNTNLILVTEVTSYDGNEYVTEEKIFFEKVG